MADGNSTLRRRNLFRGIGHAKPSGDTLTFVFDMGEGGIFHTTFVYDRDTDSWKWLMEMENDGKRTPFARVALKRQ